MKVFFTAALTAAAMPLTAACMAACPTPTQAQEVATETPSETIDRIASDYIEQGRLEAVSIGVTHRGSAETLHRGPLYRGDPAPANDETIFELRSITKTFTGTLAAQAILDGKLSLNTDIRTYLDGEYPNLEREGRPILLRHLLTHTSGLPSNNPPPSEAEPEQGADGPPSWRAFEAAELGMTRAKFFTNLAQFELASTPGEAFNYSNLGTNLTALILERAYGKSHDDLVSEFILEPAGMKDTALAITDEATLLRLAGGYSADGERVEAWPVWPMSGAEGAAKGTLPDTIRYMQFHLNEDAPAVKLSHVPLHQLDTDYHIASFWWVIDRPVGSASLRHDGGFENVRNVMILFPKDKLGIYAVTNRTAPEANAALTDLVYDIREALLTDAG